MESIINGRAVSYQNNLQRSYMVVKILQEDVVVEYQIRMIRENPTGHLLSLYKKQIDEDIFFFFDITSKITLHQLLKRIKLNKHNFLSILKSLIQSIALGKQYLLQNGGFILHGDYIYIDPASFETSIAYIPIESEADINEEVKALIMDLLIYKVSFETPSEGDFVYELLSMIKSENFSTNQLDKIISSIALQQKQENILNHSTNHDLLQKGSETRENDVKSTLTQNHYIFILVQLFFAALTVLLIKYFYFQAEKHDASALFGLGIIIIALDILFSRWIKIKYKSDSIKERTCIKTEKLNKDLVPKKNKFVDKNKRIVGVQNKALQEYAAVKEYIGPKDFETQFILEATPKLACLIGCGDNEMEKIFIDKPSFVIGRIKSQSDYVSSNSAVGKLHAEITNKDGAYFMKDLNSRNGTFINGDRILSNVEHPIQNNDRIAFANSEYKFLWS